MSQASAQPRNRHKQYDMYKRFIRWASVIGLMMTALSPSLLTAHTLTGRQDDGFRKVAAQEFSEIYILDLGSDVRRNPKISGTTHNVFGIQTGVCCRVLRARKGESSGKYGIYYAKREDAELAVDKLCLSGQS